MAFKKRKEAKELRARELSDSRVQTEKKFDASIQEAAEITDPAKKILALREISEGISAQIQSEKSAITKKAQNTQVNTELTGMGSSLAVGAGVIVGVGLLAPPLAIVGIPVMMAGVITGKIVSFKRADAAEKKLLEVSGNHIKNMEGQIDLVSAMSDVVIDSNVKELSKSPLFDKVLALPGISDRFAVAAAKEFAQVDTAPAAIVNKPEPRRKPREKQDFSKIATAIKP